MCLDNASRTGANMTCKEFDNAIYEDGAYKFAILDHKTLATFRPVYDSFYIRFIQSSTNLPELFSKFNERCQWKRSNSKVFLSWIGKRCSSSMVSAQLNSFLGKAVGHKQDQPRINATLVRKAVVSKVHKQEPGLKWDLANLMCHLETTVTRM